MRSCRSENLGFLNAVLPPVFVCVNSYAILGGRALGTGDERGTRAFIPSAWISSLTPARRCAPVVGGLHHQVLPDTVFGTHKRRVVLFAVSHCGVTPSR